MAFLRFIDDAGVLQSRSLDTEQIVIGRASTCEIIFDTDTISREHARIDVESDGRFRIRDLGSRNRTLVNGELITESLLSPGDILRIGDRVIEYRDDALMGKDFSLEFLTPDRAEPPNCEWVKMKAPLSLSLAQAGQLVRLSIDQPLLARPEDIAEAALGQLILELQADRGFIALRGDGRMDLIPLAHRALKKPPGGSLTPASQSFVFAPLLQSVAGRYPKTPSQINAKLGCATAAIVAPLTYGGEVVGLVYLDRPTSKKPFSAQSLQYCLAAAAHIGALIGETSRKLTRVAAREGAAWVTSLRHAQQAVRVPVAASESFGVALKQFQGRARCGDFVEVVHLDEHRCCAIIVDGGGHGITGLMQANAIKMSLRSAAEANEDVFDDPAPLFTSLNRSIAAAVRQVIPVCYIGLDTAAGKVTYINAGCMPPLLMVATGRLVTLDQPSLVLGVDPSYEYGETRVDLPDSFRIVCHTDGYVESTSVAGEAVGQSKLHELLLDPDSFVEAESLAERLSQFFTAHMSGAHPDDDASVLVISRS